MQPNNQINLTKDHLQVLEYVDNLFTRWSLRKNSYLFKHMKPNLQIPLFIIAQERRIAQITQSESIIIQYQALKLSQFVQVNQQSRMVIILDLPTLKFPDQPNMIKMQNIVKMLIKQKANQDKINIVKPLQYIISSKTQDGFYYITLKTKRQQDKNILKQLVQKYNKQQQQKIKYTQQSLYEDIKQCVTKLRKSRTTNPNYSTNSTNNTNTNTANRYNNQKYQGRNDSQINMPIYSRQNMMMMYPGVYYPTYNSMTPEQMYLMQSQQQQQQQQQHQISSPGPFIRKAVQSQDEQQIQKNQQEQQSNNKNIKQIQQQSSQSSQNYKKSSQQNSNSLGWKQNQKKYQQKNNHNHTHTHSHSHTHNKKKNQSQNQNQNQKKQHQKQQKKQQKANKNKIVLDDNDFPTIG